MTRPTHLAIAILLTLATALRCFGTDAVPWPQIIEGYSTAIRKMADNEIFENELLKERIVERVRDKVLDRVEKLHEQGRPITMDNVKLKPRYLFNEALRYEKRRVHRPIHSVPLIGLLKRDTSKGSLVGKRKKAAWSTDFLEKLLFS